eukprot:TRINITY_DN10065_c0_g1_i2.p2 TRINITY_DN10065_c0_g1~~TRINITY_DN10065_c0_g1_i2.p2  ORF type:complete len:163 (+),score=21.56 TRINITY_DN10065_c0_g1_i2:70-489(+)
MAAAAGLTSEHPTAAGMVFDKVFTIWLLLGGDSKYDRNAVRGAGAPPDEGHVGEITSTGWLYWLDQSFRSPPGWYCTHHLNWWFTDCLGWGEAKWVELVAVPAGGRLGAGAVHLARPARCPACPWCPCDHPCCAKCPPT